VILTTERLTLRQAVPGDARALHAVYGDPEVMRYWSSGPDRSLAETKRRVERQAASPRPDYLVIEHAGVAIGNCGHVENGEIGCILHRNYWGRGLTREAMEAVIPYLWTLLDVPALRAEADPRNTRSVGLLSQLGFQVCGYARANFPVEGVFTDTVFLTLPRPAAH